MNRIQLAGGMLMASAVILAGLLLWQIDARLVSPAQAAMAVNYDSVTLITAQTLGNEEALFILDNNSQRLLIYTVDQGRGRIELSYRPIDVRQLFTQTLGDRDARNTSRGPR